MQKKTKRHHRRFMKNKSLKHRKSLIGGNNEIKRQGEGMIDNFNNNFGSTINNTMMDSPKLESLNNIGQEASNTFQNLTNDTTNAITNAVTNIATNTVSNAIESVNEVLDAIPVQETIAEAAENTKEVAEHLIEKFNEPFEDPMFKNKLEEAAENVSLGAEIVLKAADKPIDMAIDKAAESLSRMGKATATTAVKIGTDILATLPPPIGTIVDIGRIINDSTHGAAAIVEAGTEVVETGSDLVIKTMQNIEDEVKKVGEMKEKMKEKMTIENRLNNSIENFKNPLPQYGGKHYANTRKRLFKKGKISKASKLKSKRVRFAF